MTSLTYRRALLFPSAFFDLRKNTAHINIGTSHETSEFACDSLKKWWLGKGQLDYPNATSILMIMDGGGSNSSRRYLFKEGLQNLVNEIGVEIRMAHYPPYTSKWNPIEHRVFPHVTRAMQGVILSDHDMVKQLIEKTQTAPCEVVWIAVIFRNQLILMVAMGGLEPPTTAL